MEDLTGKVAFVTGAAKGIGLGITETLSRCGAAVVMFDRDPAVEHEAQRLTGDGRAVLAQRGSVVEYASVSGALDAGAHTFGGIDFLVNCAGLTRYGTVEELSVEDWDLQIDTNLRSVFFVAKIGIPHLRSRGGGVIVSLASVQAFATQQGVPAYTASKGGIVALTRSLAVDYAAEQIRAVAIAPGSVDTPMLRASAQISAEEDGTGVEDILAQWGRSHPLGRVATVADIAELVAFVVGNRASMITGTTLTVDGGLLSGIGVAR